MISQVLLASLLAHAPRRSTPAAHFRALRPRMMAADGVHAAPAATTAPEVTFSIVREADASVDTFGQSTYGDLRADNAPHATPLAPDEIEGLLARILPTIPSLHTGEAAPPLDPARSPEPRGVYCSRALNMRSIQCIGYDMDYTLVQYHVDAWESAAYDYAKQTLANLGFPVRNLEFSGKLVVRGCIVDKVLGNFVHVDRFGYVRRALHGTRRLSRAEVHRIYGRLEVDLRVTQRWEFMNTLFSISEGCLYAQLVDKLDDGSLLTESRAPFSAERCSTYEQLHSACSRALFHAHVTSNLKADVLADPDRFVRRDPNLPLTLLDQKGAGKHLVLITNSDWNYTKQMMKYICDEYLPEGMTWRSLFDVVICSARKPAFFAETMPLYEIVDEESGKLLERFKLETGKVFCGGHARMVERLFNVEKDELLYVGDHIYTDVNMVKATMRWRTALVVQELEAEVAGLAAGKQQRDDLERLLRHKDILGNVLNHMRTEMVRHESGRPSALFAPDDASELRVTIGRLLATLAALDEQIVPRVESEGEHVNRHWGYSISRAGHSGSLLMRQIEKYADIYMSRVSNMLKYTPYVYYRNAQQSVAHDTAHDAALIGGDWLISATQQLKLELEQAARAASEASNREH